MNFFTWIWLTPGWFFPLKSYSGYFSLNQSLTLQTKGETALFQTKHMQLLSAN